MFPIRLCPKRLLASPYIFLFQYLLMEVWEDLPFCQWAIMLMMLLRNSLGNRGNWWCWMEQSRSSLLGNIGVNRIGNGRTQREENLLIWVPELQVFAMDVEKPCDVEKQFKGDDVTLLRMERQLQQNNFNKDTLAALFFAREVLCQSDRICPESEPSSYMGVWRPSRSQEKNIIWLPRKWKNLGLPGYC